MPFVSLPWYDLEAVRADTDAWYGVLAEQLERQGFGPLPARLERTRSLREQWTSPELLLSQACGFDVLHDWRPHLQLVATPCYEAPGCKGHQYASAIVVAADGAITDMESLRGSRCVVNGPTSHSGMNILRALVAPLARGGRFFGEVVHTGSHQASLRSLVRGQADVAAIDLVTHTLLRRHAPAELEGTRVLFHTPRVPAPPLVTAAGRSPEEVARLRAALRAALADPAGRPARQRLLLAGLAEVPLQDYGPITGLVDLADHFAYTEFEEPLPE